jgi:hypothetical protein
VAYQDKTPANPDPRRRPHHTVQAKPKALPLDQQSILDCCIEAAQHPERERRKTVTATATFGGYFSSLHYKGLSLKMLITDAE